MTLRPAFLVLTLLAACGQAPLRQTVPPLAPEGRVPIGFSTLEVVDVSLPDYAADDRIFVQVPGGALTPMRGAVWADDPARALTLDLSRALADLTGARIAPEPWPFEENPEARLDIRLSEIVADPAVGFLMRGQYFVASRDGSGRDSAETFRITVPLPPEPGPAAIAAARATATLQLARLIASDSL